MPIIQTDRVRETNDVTTSEYREVIDALERQFHAAGLETIADPSRFTIDDDDADDDRRLRHPEDRLVAMLEAYERHLAGNDRRAFDIALDDINAALVEGEVGDARFLPVSDADTPSAVGSDSPIAPDGSFSLRDAPDLRELRDVLDQFINELREDVLRR